MIPHPAPARVREEVEAAIRLRRKHTDQSAELKRQYAGEHYRAGFSEQSLQLNHHFEYVANLIPSLVYSNPTVTCTADGVKTYEAQATEAGLRGLLPKIDFATELQGLALDLCFDFGVGMVHLEPTPGLAEQMGPTGGYVPMRPRLTRIPPTRYFADARWLGTGKLRMEGHVIVASLEELLAERDDDGRPVYDQTVLKGMANDHGIDETMRELLADEVNIAGLSRDEVVLFEIYWRPTNHLYTLAFDQTGGVNFVREPRPYQGPTDGPYVRFGLYDVPDQLYPLSPLAVTAKLVEDANTFAELMRDDAKKAKRLTVFGGALSKESAAKVEKSNSGGTLHIPEYVKGMAESMDLGGPNPVTAEYISVVLQRLDRTSGLSEVIRGNVASAQTATEVATAAKAADIRTRYAQSRFRRAVQEVLRRIAELMWMRESVAFPITVRDEMTGEQSRSLFLGGVAEGQNMGDFQLLQIEIEPYSMEMVDQAVLQKRAQDMLALIMTAGPAIAQMPFINWRHLLNDTAATALNVPGGSDRYVNWELLAAMGLSGPMVGMGGMGMGGMPAMGTPGLGQDRATTLQNTALARAGVAPGGGAGTLPGGAGDGGVPQ